MNPKLVISWMRWGEGVGSEKRMEEKRKNPNKMAWLRKDRYQQRRRQSELGAKG